MTIGKAASAGGVSVHTLRYYERRGLLAPATRRASGYRVYTEDGVRRLNFIKRAQELGFSLEEIAGLLRLRVGRTSGCEGVRRRAETRLADVRKRIEQLGQIELALKALVSNCRTRKTTDACPILQSLEAGPTKENGTHE